MCKGHAYNAVNAKFKNASNIFKNIFLIRLGKILKSTVSNIGSGGVEWVIY